MQPLPAGSHLIHIGPQKTGSTAIQSALHQAREKLREHGVIYPGPRMRPREAVEVGLGFARLEGRRPTRLDTWHDLLRQVHEPGFPRVCVSLEAFGRATDEQAGAVVRELGGDLPHVVAVARRYDRLMPSQWQQRVKSKATLSYEEWLAIVLGAPQPDEYTWSNVWVPHDTVALVERWSAWVGPENFTLIVTDEADRRQLSHTFEAMLGLPAGTLQAQQGKENSSLTYPETELLRGLNVLFAENGWPDRDYFELVHRGVVPALVQGAGPERNASRPPRLPAWARARIVELSDRRIEGLSDLGIRVVGDLEHLRVPREQAPDEAVASEDDELLPVQKALQAIAVLAGAAVDARQVDARADDARQEDGSAPPRKRRGPGRQRRGESLA